jgi:hypothetical protein
VAAVVTAVVHVEIKVGLVRTLVLTEADVPIDAREVAVGLPAGLEMQVELQHKRRERSEQAAKGSHHMLVIAGTVLVEPRLVIVPREFLEKAERIGCETLKSNRHSCLLRKALPVAPNYIRWSQLGATKRLLFSFNFLGQKSLCCLSTSRPLT